MESIFESIAVAVTKFICGAVLLLLVLQVTHQNVARTCLADRIACEKIAGAK